jgi:hypothetical protein
MPSAALAVGVVLKLALKEPSHFVTSDWIVKERTEGDFEIPYLSIWE